MKILAFGDSHVGVWRLIDHPDHQIDVLPVDAVTAHGMSFVESESGARRLFDIQMKLGKYDVALINLGEIDCGYLIWRNATPQGSPLVTYSTDPLLEFMYDTVRDYSCKVVHLAVNPPVVEDASRPNPMYPKRLPVTADIWSRMALTHKFNRIIKRDWVYTTGFTSIWDTLLDPYTNRVMREYRRPDPYDHHLNWETTAPLWREELDRWLKQL